MEHVPALGASAGVCLGCDEALPALPQTRLSTCGSANCRAREEIARATLLRQRAAVLQGIPHDDIASYHLAILPLNPARESQLPMGRRIQLERNLRKRLAQARERITSGETVASAEGRTSTSDRAHAEHDRETQLLNTACGSCRGKCCKKGGNHAFICSETLMRFIGRASLIDDDEVVAFYLSFVAERTLTDGCIFQGSAGCTLRRDMRSDLCNRYYCGDISVLRRQFVAGDPVRAFIVNRSGAQMTNGQFVDVPDEESGADWSGRAG